jgi:hypothetical protein
MGGAHRAPSGSQPWPRRPALRALRAGLDRGLAGSGNGAGAAAGPGRGPGGQARAHRGGVLRHRLQPDAGLARRPQAAALVTALADPDRGRDAIVIGGYKRAFYGALVRLDGAAVRALRHPAVDRGGRRADRLPRRRPRADHARAGAAVQAGDRADQDPVRTAKATQTREQGRYLGGRPPYGYRPADARPHPNKAHAAWGRRAHRLEPDPDTAPVVAWMFAQRLAGHNTARITRALNDAGIPCPSAADPKRNPHPVRDSVDASDGRGDPGQSAVYGPTGVEPAAHRLRPGRPGQHRARAQAGAAVEPARGLGHLPSSRASGTGERGRFHRRPGCHRAARPGEARPETRGKPMQ